jgi:hypothetical protein
MLVYRSAFITNFTALINTYSSCDLTKPDDKLVAISGNARAMRRESVNDTYLAGLWLRSLPESLAWHAYHSILPKDSYRAPSWSWASVDGDTYFPDCYDRDQICRVSGYSIELTNTKDLFRQVKGGFIKLAGHLRTIKITYARPVKYEYFGSETHTFRYTRGRPDTTPSDLHCFPVADSDTGLWSIVLQPTGRAKGEFRRWGQCVMYEASFDITQPMFENHDWLEYESIDEDGKYVIKII